MHRIRSQVPVSSSHRRRMALERYEHNLKAQHFLNACPETLAAKSARERVVACGNSRRVDVACETLMTFFVVHLFESSGNSWVDFSALFGSAF
jgi:hypothetical protein